MREASKEFAPTPKLRGLRTITRGSAHRDGCELARSGPAGRGRARGRAARRGRGGPVTSDRPHATHLTGRWRPEAQGSTTPRDCEAPGPTTARGPLARPLIFSKVARPGKRSRAPVLRRFTSHRVRISGAQARRPRLRLAPGNRPEYSPLEESIELRVTFRYTRPAIANSSPRRRPLRLLGQG